MKEFFEYSEEITVNNVDRNRKMSIMHIFEILQLLANENAERSGYGFKAQLDRNNAFWVLTKIKLNCDELPMHREKICCKTWPIKPGKLVLERDFQIRDSKDKVLVSATSEWCLIDANTRRIKRIDGETVMPGLDYIEERAVSENYTRKKIEVSGENFCYERVIRSTDIDMNAHVNNTKYIFMIVDCFSGEFLNNNEIKSFQIHFLKECVEGDKLSVYLKKLDDKNFFVTALREGQSIFKAFISF